MSICDVEDVVSAGKTSGSEREPPRVILASVDQFFLPFDPVNITMESSNCAIAIESDTLVKRLRLELKEWEQSFAAANHGRKAGREDIKKHPEIGQRLPVCYLSHSFTDEPSTQIQAV